MTPALIALFLLAGSSSAVTIAAVIYVGFPRLESRFILVVRRELAKSSGLQAGRSFISITGCLGRCGPSFTWFRRKVQMRTSEIITLCDLCSQGIELLCGCVLQVSRSYPLSLANRVHDFYSRRSYSAPPKTT